MTDNPRPAADLSAPTAGSSSFPTETAPSLSQPRESIGPYHLLQSVGEGGMGEVWLAEQEEPVRRKVALKLIKAGMDTKEVVARFEAERQALALMDHPAIAKVYEAGATPRGGPYFAMEYVQGEPITTYCDRQRLRTRERLDLFVQVCEGVQHAHQKGVIHRDLKPSNVLVSIQGDKPVPKIIDFGVAKATGGRLTDKSMYTALGALIGTPEYMSPEQAELTGQDVDTRTDVYALGVMLYELLTGSLPFESKELRSGSFEDLRRRIREVEPAKPSTRVKTLGERSGEVARKRHTEPAKLVSRLQGDLDWIVMKALEKDRTRRYGSPSDLGADIKRHLSHEPVLAGPPSAAYRAGKFVRRHRFGVTAAAVGFVGLVGFAATTTLQAARIANERDRANREAEVSKRVSEFMTGLFQVSDPSEARGNAVTAREILDKGAEKIDKELSDSPIIQAQLMHTMALVYRSLGLLEKAEDLLTPAVRVRQRILGPEDQETLSSMQWLGWVMYQRGRYADAERTLSETLRSQQSSLGPNHLETGRTLASLASVYGTIGRFDEAEELFKRALEIRQQTLGPDHRQTLGVMSNLAFLYQGLERYDAAAALHNDILERRRRLLGADHPDTIESMSLLAALYSRAGSPEKAERLAAETLQVQQRVQGNEHPATLETMRVLARALGMQGRHGDAEKLDRQTLEIRRRVLGADHRDTLNSMENLAIRYLNQGRWEESERLHLETLESRRRVLGDRHPDVGWSHYNLACVFSVSGRHDKALRRLREAIEVGFRAFDLMAKDADLRPLHGDPEFERLVAAARRNAGQ